MRGTPVNGWLDDSIKNAIQCYDDSPLPVMLAGRQSQVSGDPLCIKYTSSKAMKHYRRPRPRLNVSDHPGFTWGTATYVSPLTNALSSAIYGRIGVVASFDPTNWQVFDATLKRNVDLFMLWLQRQRYFRPSHTTMHSAYFNHEMRNAFREHYQIDCVLFRPDQYNSSYTRPATDCWMAVTDWTSGREVDTGLSRVFDEVKVCVIVEEEFDDTDGGRRRSGFLRLAKMPYRPQLPSADVVNTFNTGGLIRIQA